MEEKVSKVENSLRESALSDVKTSPRWVHLDEGERDELAFILSGPTIYGNKLDVKVIGNHDEQPNAHERSMKPVSTSLRNSSHASELHLLEGKDVKLPGDRRTASASADIGSWNIVVTEDRSTPDSSNGRVEPPPRRVPSYSGFMRTMEYAFKSKLPKNGFRKWKAMDRQLEDDIALSRSQELSKGMDACYEKSKSCLHFNRDCDDKQIGWYGAVLRLLQRSQYQVHSPHAPYLLGCLSAFLYCFVCSACNVEGGA